MPDQSAILLAEDDPDLRNVYSTILRHFGFHVLEAEDGEEALRTLAFYGDRISLVISDLVMPKAGGREVLWRASQLYPDLPVILMSGLLTEASAPLETDVQAHRFLRKPLEPLVLADTVLDVLGPRVGGTNPDRGFA